MRPVLLLLLLAAVGYADEAVIVTRVVDGDTVVIDTGDRIRLLGIDAPEMDQPHGDQAKRWLEIFVLRRPVILRDQRRGAWGRIDARLFWEGIDVNATLVLFGHAWVAQPRYVPDSLEESWRSMQRRAERHRRGLWHASMQIEPWLWRDGVREQPAEPLPSTSMRVLPQQTMCIGGT